MKTRIALAALARRQGVRRKRIRLRPIAPSRAVERDYSRALKQMLREAAKIVREEVVPAADALRSELQHDDTGRLRRAFDYLRSWLSLRSAASAMVERILGLEYRRHTDRFSEAVRNAIGIDLRSVIGAGDLADEMALAVQRNVGLIKGLSDDVAKRVEQTVMNSVLRGDGHKTLAKKLSDDFGILDRRAELIARDQTSKLTGDLNRLRQEQLGIAIYIWRDSEDEKVRHSHSVLNGMECRWDDPTVYRVPGETEWRSRSSIGATEAHPGEDINCRCTAEAVIDL